MAYGLNNALGYNNSLQEGLTAAVGRQNAQTADKLYKNQLKNDYGYTDEDLASINGNITSDIYKNLTESSYKHQKLLQTRAIAQMKDNTSRARMIGIWLKNGQITSEDAIELMADYGITDADFQESNNTRKTDSQIELNNAKIENIKNPKPKVTINHRYNTSNINHNYNGKNKSNDNATPLGTESNKVRIQGPDGNIYRVDANRVDEYIQAGGKVIK